MNAEELGKILDDSINEIYVFDAETLRFTLVNRGARTNVGYSLEEVRALTPLDLAPEFTPDSFAELIAPLRRGETPQIDFDTVHRRKDGSTYPVEVHLQLSRAGESPVFVGIILDVADRQAQRRALAESQAHAYAVLSTAVDAIITIDASCVINSVNPATMRLFGYEESELVGQNVRMLMPAPHAELHDDYVKRYLETGEARIIGRGRELEARRKDGTVFPIRLALGEARLGESRLFTGTLHDLSETKELQEQLLHAQKMEAIGTLAGGIAHDFNNLLTAIRGSAEILSDHLEPGSRLARSARRIQTAVDRATALTTRILGFSRKQFTHRSILDVGGAVREVRELFARTLPEDVELKLNLNDEALFIHADQGQVMQVLMNLIVNAGDAMPGGGSLVLITHRTSVEGDRARALDLPSGDYVAIQVRDDGEGIPPSAIGKIFDPFFTTKEVGQGTGLGLSMSLGIVREHGGAMEVKSEVGVGTTFTVLLPVVAAPEPESVAPLPVADRARAAGETILLVEDDEVMRDLMCEVLEEAGYIVVAAADPDEALDGVRVHGDGIDLVVTDVVMPKMSGFLLAKQLRLQNRRIRILYMSGYTDQVLADRGQLGEDDPFIRKPFGNSQLLDKVREVLHPRARNDRND